MEHIEKVCSLESKLFLIYKYSIRILNILEAIAKKLEFRKCSTLPIDSINSGFLMWNDCEIEMRGDRTSFLTVFVFEKSSVSSCFGFGVFCFCEADTFGWTWDHAGLGVFVFR